MPQLNLGRVKGADGKNCHIRFNTAPQLDNNATTVWTAGQNWIGFAVTNAEPMAVDFTWSKFVPDGVVFNSQIKQESGASTSDIMSQKAVTDLFEFKLDIRDPTTGQKNALQEIINNLFNLLTRPLTAEEYDGISISATEYDGKNIPAIDFDMRGRVVLI